MGNSDYRDSIERCFSGEIARDCKYCDGHSSMNGTCCFGKLYTDDDEECQECIHGSDCASVTQGNNKSVSRPRRILIKSNKRRITINPTRRNEPVVEVPVIRDNPTTIAASPEEAKLTRLAKFTGWGMIEGGLQFALSFFQGNRPE